MSTTLSINVKNVQTYYTNGMLNNQLDLLYYSNGQGNMSNDLGDKLDDLMIYDLIDQADRVGQSYSTDTLTIRNKSLNGVRRSFMTKKVILSNEEFGGYSVNKKTWMDVVLDTQLSWNKNLSFWRNLGSNLLNVMNVTTKHVHVGATMNL